MVAEVSERLRKTCTLQDRFGRRASACAITRLPDGTRPSVSSIEDFQVTTPQRSFDSTTTMFEGATLPVEVPERIRKKSVSGPSSRKQSTTMAPVISVSSVAENTETCMEEVDESCPDQPLQENWEEESAKEEKEEGSSGKVNEICPWEDE